jgi:hypothetical protein
MAIQSDWTDQKTDITISDAYIRIASISGGKHSPNIEGAPTWGFTAIAHVWASETARSFESHSNPDLKKYPISEIGYFFELASDDNGDIIETGVDFIAQLYGHLKALPEYSGAVDA